MCDYIPRLHANRAELVILGSGSPDQAAWFVQEYAVTAPVYTDPALRSHAIVGAGRARPLDVRPLVRAVRAMRQGFRQTKTMGPPRQLGGVFVITSDGRMPYHYLSQFAGDHPNPDDALQVLEQAP